MKPIYPLALLALASPQHASCDEAAFDLRLTGRVLSWGALHLDDEDVATVKGPCMEIETRTYDEGTWREATAC